MPQEEEPKEEIITHNVNTQTEEQERKRPPKLPKDRYKTAIIIPETPQKAYHTDDEIEVVVKKDPGLIEEIVRKPEPPPILVQEIDLRPPPPEPVPRQEIRTKEEIYPSASAPASSRRCHSRGRRVDEGRASQNTAPSLTPKVAADVRSDSIYPFSVPICSVQNPCG